MSTLPSDDEAAAIAAALLRVTALSQRTIALANGEPSWRVAARREGVRPNVPATWRD